MATRKTSEQSGAPDASGNQPNVEKNKYLAAICYFGIFWIVPFALGKKNEFVMFHAKQGIVLSLAWLVVVMISWIPIINFIIGLPATILLIIINVLAILKTWRGERWELPFLAHYVKVLNL